MEVEVGLVLVIVVVFGLLRRHRQSSSCHSQVVVWLICQPIVVLVCGCVFIVAAVVSSNVLRLPTQPLKIATLSLGRS